MSREDLGDSIRISGNIRVPCFLNAPGCPPGSEFLLGPDGLPQRIPGNTTLANVVCVIPKNHPAAVPPVAVRPRPARQRRRGHRRQRARRWPTSTASSSARPTGPGMSTTDVPNVLTLLQDLSRFPTLADRAQQGFLNFMYVGRWMLKRDWGDVHGRPVAPLLRRQLAGRHHGRRAHGARPGLRARRARRARDELLDAAAPLGGLRHVRARRDRGSRHRGSACTTPIRTSSSGRCSCR